LCAVHAGAKQRVLEQGQDRHRVTRPEDAFQHQPQQRRRRRGVERRAAGIVGLDAEAAQLGRHTARQRAVGGDEGGRAVLQRQPERDRDGQRLLALVGRLDQRHAVEDTRRG
jgi:hypothetical protein